MARKRTEPAGQPADPVQVGLSVPNEDPKADAARDAARPEPIPAADPEAIGKEVSDKVQETSELHPDGKKSKPKKKG